MPSGLRPSLKTNNSAFKKSIRWHFHAVSWSSHNRLEFVIFLTVEIILLARQDKWSQNLTRPMSLLTRKYERTSRILHPWWTYTSFAITEHVFIQPILLKQNQVAVLYLSLLLHLYSSALNLKTCSYSIPLWWLHGIILYQMKGHYSK